MPYIEQSLYLKKSFAENYSVCFAISSTIPNLALLFQYCIVNGPLNIWKVYISNKTFLKRHSGGKYGELSTKVYLNHKNV